MTKLECLIQTAQADADRTGQSYAILNLNPYSPLYVIREWRDDYPAREVVKRIDPSKLTWSGLTEADNDRLLRDIREI